MPQYKWRYSFDGNTITVATDDPHWKISAATKSWKPCEHLKPYLKALLLKGATIEGVDGGYSKVDFVMYLNKGPYPDTAEKLISESSLTFGANNDQHYPVDYSWVCEQCRQGLAWLQSNATIKAI